MITGMGGFVGRHLTSYLASVTGAQLYGTDRHCPPCIEDEMGLGNRLLVLEADLGDKEQVRDVISDARPDWIFHLAAQAFVPTAWEDPTGTLVNNIVGQVNLLESVIALGISPSILIVCSNEEYGMVEPEDLPIKETTPFRPANPYAVSKVAQDMLGYQYWVSHRLPIVRVRPFNHLGPGQSDRFVASNFARQIAEAELGIRPAVIKVGNLEAARDFTDVRDIVRGYYLALLKGQAGDVYNLGSCHAVTVKHLLELLLAQSRVPMQVETDPTRERPADVPIVIADCGKFHALTGWRAEIPLEQTVSDLLAYWREKLTT